MFRETIRNIYFKVNPYVYQLMRGRRGDDRMVVGFTTTCASSAYLQQGCEFEHRSGEVYSIQHYVIKFVSDLRLVGGFLQLLRFPSPTKLTATI